VSDRDAAAAASGNRRREVAWLATLMLAVTVVRVVALSADPSMDIEGGFIYDWGEWAKNARLHALWGVWTVDDYNTGIYTAFGFTMAVRLAFEAFGVAQSSANLVNALAGVFSVLVTYRVVRVFASGRVALSAAALAGFAPLMIAYDRSGYPESFQNAFMVAAVAAVFSTRRSVAALGGVAFAFAILAKWTGLIVIPIAVVSWVVLWGGDRLLHLEPRFSWNRLLIYWTAAAAIMIPMLLAFIVPHWHEIAMQFVYSAKTIFTPTERGATPYRVSLFGQDTLGFRFNGFFRMQWFVVAAAGLFAAGRISRTLRQPLTQIELACWAWLAGTLLYSARQYYQPDRRFLILVPPLVILSGLFLARDITVGTSGWRSPRWRAASTAVAAALLAGLAAFYLTTFYTAWALTRVAFHSGLTLSYSSAAGLIVTAAVMVAGGAGWWFADRLPQATFRRQWLLVPVFSLLMLGRWSWQMYHRGHSMERIRTVVGRITDQWPASQRVVQGATAATFTMGTRALGVSIELEGPPAMQRYHHRLDMYIAKGTMPVDPRFYRPPPGEAPKMDCAQLPLQPPRYTIHLFVDTAMVDQCRTAATAP